MRPDRQTHSRKTGENIHRHGPDAAGATAARADLVRYLELLHYARHHAAVGGNEELMRNLPPLGGKTLLLTLACVTGFLTCVAVLRRWFRAFPLLPAPGTPQKRLLTSIRRTADGKRAGALHPYAWKSADSGFFRRGSGAGPAGPDSPLFCGSQRHALCALAAHGPGGPVHRFGPTNGRNSAHPASPRMLLAPLATTADTFAGVASLFLAYSLADSLTIGAGFAYRLLLPVLHLHHPVQRGAELGTVALLSNIPREIPPL